MTKLLPPPNDRTSRLIVCVAVGLLVFALVILFSLLVADVDDDSDRDGSSGRCAPAVAGTVDPVTCLPYGSTGAGAAGTNNSGSSTQKQPKAPAVKAPAAPAPKAPAPPPVRLTK
ncbi:hypothetical protein [Streptomyces sp. NPDC059850]|uniref:hypothetical protein n=1 Tax=Streptomyces sp. NPDC059850 TaxID=3346970 RepID=UPI0036502268